MPRPNLPTVVFDPDGGPIWVEITFPNTLLFCHYKLQLREADSNASVDGYRDIRGDNENLQDDTYALPLPVRQNDRRVLRVVFTIFTEEHDGGEYTIIVRIKQDGIVRDEKTFRQPPGAWQQSYEQYIRKLVAR